MNINRRNKSITFINRYIGPYIYNREDFKKENIGRREKRKEKNTREREGKITKNDKFFPNLGHFCDLGGQQKILPPPTARYPTMPLRSLPYLCPEQYTEKLDAS